MIFNRRLFMAAAGLAVACAPFSSLAEDVSPATEQVQERLRTAEEEGRGVLERTREEATAKSQNEVQNRVQTQVQTQEGKKEQTGFLERVKKAVGAGDEEKSAGPEAKRPPVAANADRTPSQDRVDQSDQDRDGDRVQDQDRDRKEEPDQDRDRDRLRDRIEEPDQDRDRLRDRTETPDLDRNRDMSRPNAAERGHGGGSR
jgi:hypothetical protein